MRTRGSAGFEGSDAAVVDRPSDADLGGLLLYLANPDAAIVFNRYAGYVDNPNAMALYIVVVTPVFFGLLRARVLPNYLSYPLIGIFFLTSLQSLVLAGSFSGMILFFIVIATTFLKSIKAVLLAAAGALAIYLTIQLFEHAVILWAQDMAKSDFAGFRRTGNLILNVFFGFNTAELGSMSYRLQTQEFIFHKQFSDLFSIILGLGPGQSKLLIQQVDGNSVTIHNFYLRVFAEFGILGSLAFIAMVYAFFRRYTWQYSSLRIVSGILLASMGTPALYLPFFWMPPLAAVAAMTLFARRLRVADRRGLTSAGAFAFAMPEVQRPR